MTEGLKFIRKADKNDASRLAEILIFAKRTAYRNIFNDDKTSFGEMQILPLALEYRDNSLLLNGVYVFDDEFVKGMINIVADEQFEIKELYIDPFFQGQGLGGIFLSHADMLAHSLGYNSIILWVLEKNISASKFYEKNGYTATGEKRPEEGTGEFVVCYKKPIGKTAV